MAPKGGFGARNADEPSVGCPAAWASWWGTYHQASRTGNKVASSVRPSVGNVRKGL